jgi:hypothetical protein
MAQPVITIDTRSQQILRSAEELHSIIITIRGMENDI